MIPELTERERQTLLVYAQIGDYEEAAHYLGVTRACLRGRLLRARQKLGAVSSMDALYRLLRQEVPQWEPEFHIGG